MGEYGVGVEKSVKTYKAAGMTKVSSTMYPGKRHEILNEDNRLDVMNDVYAWINKEFLVRS